MIAIGNKNLFTLVAGEVPDWIFGRRAIPQPDGAVTVELLDGRVNARVDDGSWSSRDPGSAGVFERARINGNTIVYMPAGAPEVFPYFELP